MHIAFLTDNLSFSGGRKVLVDYARHLAGVGHRTEILALEARGALAERCSVRTVESFKRKHLPTADLYVASNLRIVQNAVRSRRGPVVNFCQGFPIAELEQRVSGDVVPAEFQFLRGFSSVRLARKRIQWRRKIARHDRVFRLPTHLVAVSPHLKARLEDRYGRPVHLCRNGVDQDAFFANDGPLAREFTAARPCRVISVGPITVTAKGIADTVEAVRIARGRGCPIQLIRVCGSEFEPTERASGVVDEFYTGLSPMELGDLFRSCDVYISNSLESEGFGLPAMESLACGLPSILSDISSYRGFADDGEDQGRFCEFVPQRSPAAAAVVLQWLIEGPAERRESLRNRALAIAAGYSRQAACARFAEIMSQIAVQQHSPAQPAVSLPRSQRVAKSVTEPLFDPQPVF